MGQILCVKNTFHKSSHILYSFLTTVAWYVIIDVLNHTNEYYYILIKNTLQLFTLSWLLQCNIIVFCIIHMQGAIFSINCNMAHLRSGIMYYV